MYSNICLLPVFLKLHTTAYIMHVLKRVINRLCITMSTRLNITGVINIVRICYVTPDFFLLLSGSREFFANATLPSGKSSSVKLLLCGDCDDHVWQVLPEKVVLKLPRYYG